MPEVYLCFRKSDIHHDIEEFNKLDLKLNRSPSDKYFLNVFDKIYSKKCLEITSSLLDKLLSKHNIIIDVKSFLYAYVIVINHHEIFGFNTKLEQSLIKISLDMLYTFGKICDNIIRNHLTRLDGLIVGFINKYKTYQQYFQEWRSNEAKELLSVLIYTYYKLRCCHKRDRGTMQQMNDIETKVKYLMFDYKMDVATYIDNYVDNQYLNDSCKIIKMHYWDILLYNLSNNIQLNTNIRRILQFIQETCTCKNVNPIPIYLKYIGDMSLDYELFGNKYFLNVIYYLIELQENHDEDNSTTTEFQKDVIKHICHKKYKHFARKLLKDDYSTVIPKFFREFGKEILFNCHW